MKTVKLNTNKKGVFVYSLPQKKRILCLVNGISFEADSVVLETSSLGTRMVPYDKKTEKTLNTTLWFEPVFSPQEFFNNYFSTEVKIL